MHSLLRFPALLACATVFSAEARTDELTLNELDYFERPGLSVYVYSDHYLEGRQGGLIVVQHDDRVASNGDLTLEPAPGQWQPFSEDRGVFVDHERAAITASRGYPNHEAATRSFNPIPYPDLELAYDLTVTPADGGFRVRVDLAEPLPADWVGKVGFNLELFPGAFFGKRFLIDGHPGSFPRQFNGPRTVATEANPFYAHDLVPLAEGQHLIVSVDDPSTRLAFRSVAGGPLQLFDGRGQHDNGWFVVRALVPADATEGAIEWLVEPHQIPGWTRPTTIQVSQVGYDLVQPKRALLETDPNAPPPARVELLRFEGGDEPRVLAAYPVTDLGRYRKYHYYSVDFSNETRPGVYALRVDGVVSTSFALAADLYADGVWQPTLDVFLPVQMCHLRVNDRYRVWHGACHLDDALMAPINHAHFDGYNSGPDTLTPFAPGEPVPGLNVGGWHDAGDYDLRVESQVGTIRALSFIWDEFRPLRDQTLVDQEARLVELFTPDGVPDILQQIEHGLASVLGGYEALGRLYRGIISNHLRQYVHLGDAATMTDNLPLSGTVAGTMHPHWSLTGPDDRWVFTEDNPRRALEVAAGLTTAARALHSDRPELAARCLAVATVLWHTYAPSHPQDSHAGDAAAELFLATGEATYRTFLLATPVEELPYFAAAGWSLSRVVAQLDDPAFQARFEAGLAAYRRDVDARLAANPYRVPLVEQTWGSVWRIQAFALQQSFLLRHAGVTEARQHLFDTLDFILGIHPGKEITSFVSGVGTHSPLVAYGVNRADWSYIPGGVVSGVGYIKPDFPEFKTWPFFWQQGEYVMGGGATHFVYLTLAVQRLLAEEGSPALTLAVQP